MEDSDSDHYELITCKGKSCGREFAYILKHLSQSPECEKAYTIEEREMLKKESASITREIQLSQKRSKYQLKKLDEKWMEKKRLKERKRYNPLARSERHKREYKILKDEQHREHMESHIRLSKQKKSKLNKAYRETATERLQRQINNLKEPKLSREIRLEIRNVRGKIEEIYQSIEKQGENACAIAQTKQSWVQTTVLFDAIKCSEMWIENFKYLQMSKEPCQCRTCFNKEHKVFMCKRLVRQMEDKEEKYTCPGCQEKLDNTVFKKHYDQFVQHGECKK